MKSTQRNEAPMIQTTQAIIDHCDAEAQKRGSLYATVEEIAAASGEGPGAYGGPAEERIAGTVEREALRMAGYRETRLQTLWISPHGGFLSVDEALDEIASH